MVQMLRVAALGASVVVWLTLALVILPAADTGRGHSPHFQTFVAAAFVVGLAWAAAAIAYDRRRRRMFASATR